MPSSRVPLLHLTRSVAVRPNVLPYGCLRLAPRRAITADEKPLPEADSPQPEPNQEQLPHVSEEASTMGKISGDGGPEVEEQSTPIEEVLSRDKEAQKKAPTILKEEKAPSVPKGSRSYSTSSRRRAQALMNPEPSELQQAGHIFGLPTLPLPSTSHIKHRYDPIVDQVTKLMMKDGKLSKAQRNMAMILERLRTASPPSAPQRPLLPGSPPTSHLPLNPILYLTLAIDSVAPLMRMRSQKGAAGGGVALQIPVPLSLRQRRRTAIMWILDAASKKRNTKGSGRTMFAYKVADELVSIVDGKSGVWDKRGGVHRLGVSARANLSSGPRRRR